jgi:predicted nucleotidyltransferase
MTTKWAKMKFFALQSAERGMAMAETAVAVPDSSIAPSVRPGAVTFEKIVAAVEQIVRLAKPQRVVAFGSRARGTHSSESDLDLAVVLSGFDDQRDRSPVMRSDLDVWMPVDLLVVGQERHEFMKDSIISVHHDIALEGVTLYDAGVGSIDLGAVARIAG